LVAFVISWLLMRRLSTFSVVLTSLSLQAKVKILVGFCQVISSFRAVYGVSIDDKLKAWFNFFSYFSLDFLQIIKVPRDCLGSKTATFILNACWPYVLCTVLIFGLFLFLIIWEHLKETRTTDMKTRFGMMSLSIVIVVFYFALPTVSRSIFDAKKCRAFKTNDANDTSTSYLMFAMDMECDVETDENYSSLLDLFWIFFALWPCLTPLLFLLLLAKITRSVQQSRPTLLARTCRFLWEDFDETSPLSLHWDVIDTTRKIFLTGFINLIDPKEGSNKILRLSVACVVSTLYLTALLSVRPYKRIDDLYLSTISSSLLVVCFALGIILHHCEGDDENEQKKCHTFVGYQLDSYKASIAVTALTFGMVIITIFLLFFQAYRAPIVRLLSTGYPPNLEMPPDCEHHLFLSHVWESGQDKTHTIARTLQLYLPRLAVWLDVDDLDDVERLEECIAESAVILIFYSENYFRSFNCRREFYAAVALEKPIIVVYEGDDSVVDKMKEECAKYCTEKYRNEGIDINHVLENILAKDPICILKAGSFSAETLKLVYLRLLRSLPFYRDSKRRELLDKGLHMPRDLAEVSLTCQTKIIVCEENVGAYDLAKEIQALCPDRISIEVTKGEQEEVDKRSRKSTANVFPIKEGDDIEEGLSLCKGFPAAMFNKGEALLRNSKADEDDLSEGKSKAYDLSSIGVDSSVSWGADVLMSSYSGIADDESSNGKKVFYLDNTGKIDLSKYRGGLDDNLSLGSNTDIRSPDGITNHDSLKKAQDLFYDDVIINLVEEEESSVELDNVPPPIEKQVLLLYLNNGISLDKESKTLEIVKMAKNKGIYIILVHEQDVDKGGCPFSLIIEKTSTEMLDPPFKLFREIAIPLYTRDEYRTISLRLILQKMGATTERSAGRKTFTTMRRHNFSLIATPHHD